MVKPNNQKDSVPETEGKLLDDSIRIIEDARVSAYRAVNTALIQRNWLLGKRIAEEELLGNREYDYGKDVINKLSKKLTALYGNGYSTSNLYYFTQFYKMFPDIFHALRGQSLSLLSWTHYRALLQIQDKEARDWYLKEASEQNWSYRTLERNIDSDYYYRLLSNNYPTSVKSENISEGFDKLEFLKNPVIAEFLGLNQNTKFNETDLEESIILNIKEFLMEMGKGYAFITRQQRIQTEKQDYFIDLVFYNTDLQCYVLVDLKTSKITHRDIGQMDMYVRMYDEFKKKDWENPTLGIILCSETDEDVAHYSILNGNEQLFATKYMTYLPSKEELRAEIEAQKRIFYLQQKGPDSDK